MAALTIRGLDPETAQALKDEARRRGSSVNLVVKQLVREGLGLTSPKRRRHIDLDALAGTWSRAEAQRFQRSVAPFERVDEDLWR